MTHFVTPEIWTLKPWENVKTELVTKPAVMKKSFWVRLPAGPPPVPPPSCCGWSCLPEEDEEDPGGPLLLPLEFDMGFEEDEVEDVTPWDDESLLCWDEPPPENMFLFKNGELTLANFDFVWQIHSQIGELCWIKCDKTLRYNCVYLRSVWDDPLYRSSRSLRSPLG